MRHFIVSVANPNSMDLIIKAYVFPFKLITFISIRLRLQNLPKYASIIRLCFHAAGMQQVSGLNVV